MKPLSEKQASQLAEARQQIAAGQSQAAVETLTEIRRKNPHPDVLVHLARGLMNLGQPGAARPHLEKARAAVPTAIPVYLLIAQCFRSEGNLDSAERVLEEALTARPGDHGVIVRQAELLHARGRYQEAIDLLQPLVDQNVKNHEVLFEHARLSRLLGNLDAAEFSLRFAARAMPQDVDPMFRANLQYEMAAVLDRMGNYDGAWTIATDANRSLPQRFRPDAHDAMVDAVIAAWTPEAIAALPKARVEHDLPIFVLGMPRSGTTLVEQILASHPEVHAGGERSKIFELIHGLEPHSDGLPARLTDLTRLTQSAVDRAARAYTKQLRKLDKSATRITDKQPFNFLYLGFIACLFPKARILHCTRHPLDVAVSCYLTSFMGTVWFSTDLQHIARFQAAYERLMAHWTKVLEASDVQVLDVPYESLTADQDAWSRRLIEFAGLPWDDQCLRFHEVDRTAWTASIDQVRQPMYRSSVERWRHYAAHLAPISGEASGAAAGAADAGSSGGPATAAPPAGTDAPA